MIGIITPMRAEFAACTGRLAQPERIATGPFETVGGTIAARRGRVCLCGIGKTAAAAAAQWLIDSLDVKVILVCGAAGSLVPQLKLGDVIFGEEVVQADCGIWADEGFCFTGTVRESDPGLTFDAAYPASEALLAAARSARDESTGISYEVVPGRIVTCDQATFSRQRREELAMRFSALAVEMEGAAVAQVAQINHLPCLVLRAISDEIDFGLNATRVSSLGVSSSPHPGLREAIARAADNASRFVAATIERIP